MEGKLSTKQMVDVVVCIFTLSIIAIAVLTGFYTVSEQERAVVIRFGVPVSVQGPGAHIKIPFIEQVKKVPMVSKSFPLGYRQDEYQNTTSVEAEAFMITKDFNFVNVDFFVEYRVSDPVKYLFESKEPDAMLKNIVQAEVRTVVSEYNVDDVLTTAKTEIQAKVKERVTAYIDELDIGLILINVSLLDAEPPTKEVIEAFKNVENAKQQRETSINQATKEYNEAIPAARAEADAIKQEAAGYRQSRINQAIGQVSRFNEMFNEYVKNPEITRTRLYLEAMEDILPGVRLFVTEPGNTLEVLDLTKGAVNDDDR